MTAKPAATGAPTATESDIADRLQRVVARLGRVLRQSGSGGLTPSQVSMLASISKHDGARIGELAALESVGAPVATRLVASLEALALVKREADCNDGRASLVHVNAKGTRTLAGLRRERGAALLVRMDDFTAADVEALARALPLLERLAGD